VMLIMCTGADKRHLSEVERSLGEASCGAFEERIRQATKATTP
jgi:hypothetical protein